MRLNLIKVALLVSLFFGAHAQANDFPRPPELEPAVAFWKDVFAVYSEHQVVLHDRHHTHIVYKILDFTDVVPLLDEEELWLYKKKIENEEKAALKELMLQLADNPKAVGLTQEAHTLRDILQAHGVLNRESILKAADALRGQRGLREKTMAALMRSGRYLPYMEQVFEGMGLPTLLTRLPFVESSFSNAAYSKTGAAGMWQFMPGTARVYMNYDEIGDERRDPWFSSEAAAKHLRDDYEMLQSWPLALTAYNFGRNGIARALAEIDGKTLVDMIQRYEHPRWGFAGKNFYAEFLAVVDIEQNALQYFGPIRREDPQEFQEFKTQSYVRYDSLQAISGLDLESFADWNPSFSAAVQQGHLYVPPGKRIRVPKQQAQGFQVAYANLGDDQVFQRQRSYFVTHRVRRGDTLSGIAQRYRTTIARIRQANGLRSKSFIRVGQRLKVPSQGSGGASTSVARATAPAFYQVSSGDTLGGIAAKFGLATAQLQKHNGIKNASSLRAGARIKIPAQAAAVKTAFHTVRPGDTLSAIARRYEMSLSQLQRQNGIKQADSLRVGTKLQITAKARKTFHVIRSGQTLESIARRYGVSVRALATENDLKDLNFVKVGQRLRLPEG